MSEMPRKPLTPEERARLTHFRFLVKMRATLKLILATLAIVQIIVFIFAFFVHQLSPGEGDTPLMIFEYASCLLVSKWLLSDAKRAWMYASANGYIARGEEDLPEPWQIAKNCPRRWFVTLYGELHPDLRPLAK